MPNPSGASKWTKIPSGVPVLPAVSYVRKAWRFEVIDITALAKAHPELVVVVADIPAINAKLMHTQCIAGIRVWQS